MEGQNMMDVHNSSIWSVVGFYKNVYLQKLLLMLKTLFNGYLSEYKKIATFK